LESADGSVAVLSFELAGDQGRWLTPAESEVVAYLLKGCSNAQIASFRGSSRHTVANQVASAFRKLGIRSRLELVALAPLLGPALRR
jgi:DNA-binding CsgD family transcriptional regulator